MMRSKGGKTFAFFMRPRFAMTSYFPGTKKEVTLSISAASFFSL
jgi:hypothetical protein